MATTSIGRITIEAVVGALTKWLVGALWLALSAIVLRAYPLLPTILGLMTLGDWLPWVGLVLASVLLLRGSVYVLIAGTPAHDPIYFQKADVLDLDRFMGALSTVEHKGLQWKPTMPSVPDAAVGNSYLPEPRTIGVRSEPLCPHCSNALLSESPWWMWGVRYYCVACDWRRRVRAPLRTLQREAAQKAQGAYRKILDEKGLRPGIEVI